MPRIPELDTLLEELKGRNRQQGVDTLLVNSFGRSWSADGFGGSFNRIRDAAGIVHTDPETGTTKAKHLHDFAEPSPRSSSCMEQISRIRRWPTSWDGRRSRSPTSAASTLTKPASLWQSASGSGGLCKTPCKTELRALEKTL